MMRTSDCALLKKKPSDYMRDMFFTSQPMEMVDNREALQLTFKMINAETQLLYSSDYRTGTWTCRARSMTCHS